MLKHFQSVVDHLNLHMVGQEERQQGVHASPSYQSTPRHTFTEACHTTSGLSHVQSIRAHIEATSPAVKPLRPYQTGPLPTRERPEASRHQPESLQQLTSASAHSVGGESSGKKTLVPSGRGVEPLRISRRLRVSIHQSPDFVSPNIDQPDIQDLRRALKPVLTGNKVKKVVERWDHLVSSAGSAGIRDSCKCDVEEEVRPVTPNTSLNGKFSGPRREQRS